MDAVSNSHFYSVIYTLSTIFIGVGSLIAFAIVIPKLLNRFSPEMDEQREIAMGNRAAADYFGKIVASLIIGFSIIIAASILAGLS